MRYREKNPCVYILASWRYGTLVTSDLFQRVALRNQYLIEGFTKVVYPPASNTVIFVVMAIVLLVKPAGLFGQSR